jgi:hypothetical protein|tara:strand:+ start:654 stop:881 length:228 start_codon:yes stop_codon:yes gene_type:complete
VTTINEAKAKARHIKYHVRQRFLEQEREAYYNYRSESRACGYEVESFEEYIGDRNLKDEFAEFYASLTEQELSQY